MSYLSVGSAKSAECGGSKGDGLLPIPSHIYAGEPLYHCRAEAAASPLLPPPASFSPLPALLPPDLLFPPLYHHHHQQQQQALEMSSQQGLFNSYQYFQVVLRLYATYRDAIKI